MGDSISSKLTLIHEKVDEVSDMVNKIDKDVALQKAAFDDHLKQDERMYEEFKRMNDILQQNTESLKEHMHRTNLLEQLVDKMDKRLSPIELERIEEEAVKKYRNERLKKIGKILGLIGAVVGIIAAIKAL